MSIFGNPLKIGGSGGGGGSLPMCIGFLWGMSNGATYQTIGNSNGVSPASGYYIWQDFYDSNYFTYVNGVFTFTQAGTYDIYYGGRGGCNTSGTVRYLYFKIYQNSTTIAINESNIMTNSGGGNKVTITAAVGDTLYAQIRTNSGALTMDFFLGIVKTS